MGTQAVGKWPQTLLPYGCAQLQALPMPGPGSPSLGPWPPPCAHDPHTTSAGPRSHPASCFLRGFQSRPCRTAPSPCPAHQPRGLQDVTASPPSLQSGCVWPMGPMGVRAAWRCGTAGAGAPCATTAGTRRTGTWCAACWVSLARRTCTEPLSSDKVGRPPEDNVGRGTRVLGLPSHPGSPRRQSCRVPPGLHLGPSHLGGPAASSHPSPDSSDH